jgi:hypothetical protein
MDFGKPKPEDVDAFHDALPDDPRVKRVPMFGLPHGKVGEHMFAGRHGRGVTVRLAPEEQAPLIAEGAAQFEPMPGRPMREWLILPAPMAARPDRLRAIIGRAFAYALTLPPKKKKAAAKGTAAKKPKKK